MAMSFLELSSYLLTASFTLDKSYVQQPIDMYFQQFRNNFKCYRMLMKHSMHRTPFLQVSSIL